MLNDKEQPTFKEGSYAHFHFANKGKEFLTEKGRKSKLDLWIEYHKNASFLEQLTKGKAKGFLRVDKLGWKDGVIEG